VALGVVLASIAALGDPSLLGEVPEWTRMLYPLAMAALLAGYSRVTGDVWSYAGAAAAAAVGCVDYTGRAYAYLHQRVTGLNALAWGVLFFFLAVLISLLKFESRPRWLRRRSR
jgi:hypothetical protein